MTPNFQLVEDKMDTKMFDFRDMHYGGRYQVHTTQQKEFKWFITHVDDNPEIEGVSWGVIPGIVLNKEDKERIKKSSGCDWSKIENKKEREKRRNAVLKDALFDDWYKRGPTGDTTGKNPTDWRGRPSARFRGSWRLADPRRKEVKGWEGFYLKRHEDEFREFIKKSVKPTCTYYWFEWKPLTKLM